MPTTIEIPAQRKRVCAPCEHHKCTGSFHVRSGSGGWREYACTHAEAFEPTDNAELAKLQGRILQIEGGRPIGRTERQPEWCPLLRERANTVLTDTQSYNTQPKV